MGKFQPVERRLTLDDRARLYAFLWSALIYFPVPLCVDREDEAVATYRRDKQKVDPEVESSAEAGLRVGWHS